MMLLTTHNIIFLPALHTISSLISRLFSYRGGMLENTEEGGEFYANLHYSHELY